VKEIANISNNIKRLSKNHSELARKAGIPLSTLQKIIYKQKNDIKLSSLVAIAKALKVSVDELLR